MGYEDVTGVALGITLVSSLGVVAYLHNGLRAVLTEYCGSPARAKFWGGCGEVLLIFVPLTAELIAVGTRPPRDVTVLLAVIDLLKWGLAGLVVAVLVLATGVGLFARGGPVPVWVDPEGADDLRRMLDRVQMYRARQLVAKAERRAAKRKLTNDQ
jgi:hypothetical protein